MVRNFVAKTATSETHVILTDISDAHRASAQAWPIWDSARDFVGQKVPKFPLRYRREEHVLILEGRAVLTPHNGDTPFEVGAGDAVIFRAGFASDWRVVEPMRKHYQYYAESAGFADGTTCNEPSGLVPVIACDACGKECCEESYLVDASAEDVCPKCFKKARGPDKKRYAGAARCLFGELAEAVEQADRFDDESAAKKKKRKPAAADDSPKKQRT